jgi:hypothetical protein
MYLPLHSFPFPILNSCSPPPSAPSLMALCSSVQSFSQTLPPILAILLPASPSSTSPCRPFSHPFPVWSSHTFEGVQYKLNHALRICVLVIKVAHDCNARLESHGIVPPALRDEHRAPGGEHAPVGPAFCKAGKVLQSICAQGVHRGLLRLGLVWNWCQMGRVRGRKHDEQFAALHLSQPTMCRPGIVVQPRDRSSRPHENLCKTACFSYIESSCA